MQRQQIVLAEEGAQRQVLARIRGLEENAVRRVRVAEEGLRNACVNLEESGDVPELRGARPRAADTARG